MLGYNYNDNTLGVLFCFVLLGFLFCFVCFQNRISLCSSGYPGTRSVDQIAHIDPPVSASS